MKNKSLILAGLLFVSAVNAVEVNEIEMQNEQIPKEDENKLTDYTRNQYLNHLGFNAVLDGALSALFFYGATIIDDEDTKKFQDRYKDGRPSSLHYSLYDERHYSSLFKTTSSVFALLSVFQICKLIKTASERAKEKSYDKKHFMSIKEDKKLVGLSFSTLSALLGTRVMIESFKSNIKREVGSSNALLVGAGLLYSISIGIAANCAFDLEKKKEDLI